ncbi:MAG: formimidoylglutamate deiminase [Steroidobacterales bacterium]
MTRQYHLSAALLAQGWSRHVNISVADSGLITGISSGVPPPDAQRIGGIVFPGMPNAHSHAFQRAMAGTAEYRISAADSFWTWRDAMYRLANRLDPEQLRIVATQLFVEMLKAGYTSVAEFHYLHRRTDGSAYAGNNELWDAIRAAAATAGIGLTLLPTLYQSSDFGGAPLKAEQRRFAVDIDAFVRAIDHAARAGAASLTATTSVTGAAFHSLRAVPVETLCEVTRQLRSIEKRLPLHIHVAEQLREVQSCRRHSGMRPVELLLQTGLIDEHWCLVHATHATAAELRGIAAAGATVCVSVTTEANLGDGVFAAPGFLKARGRLCVGSDSQSTVSPAEELRWLEYEQRLRRRRRGILATRHEAHVGTRLWREAASAGAQALGQPVGSIEVGRRADWLVLDPSHPALAGASLDGTLDHVLFAGAERAISDVMVAGHWVVKGGHHAAEGPARGDFAALMHALRAAGPAID